MADALCMSSQRRYHSRSQGGILRPRLSKESQLAIFQESWIDRSEVLLLCVLEVFEFLRFWVIFMFYVVLSFFSFGVCFRQFLPLSHIGGSGIQKQWV